MEEAEESVCAVCLDALTRPATTATLPGCGHKLHVTCLINCAQYDARCPVCRGVGDGVVLREAPVITITQSDLDAQYQEYTLEWRRYAARRRRVLRQRPWLAERLAQLKEVRVQMERSFAQAQRVYDARCRDVWRSDPEVTAHRAVVARLRRRERRLDRTVGAELESLLGPEP